MSPSLGFLITVSDLCACACAHSSSPQNDSTEPVRATGVDSGGKSSEAVGSRVTPLQGLVQRIPGGSGSVPTGFLYQTDGNVPACLWEIVSSFDRNAASKVALNRNSVDFIN